MAIRFDGRVAIVTGAGAGLGRQHALELARRGARVVVNDFGGGRDGTGGSSAPAEAVANEIRTMGSDAIAHGADVTSEDQVADMVRQTLARWGRIDILVNNAGILRDASFVKSTLADFRKVIDVHLMGSVICTQAVWPVMREANYGRIVFTTSSSGLYGNFGQASYAAAKTALIGLMNVLPSEGRKNDVRVNLLGPGAATRMTQDLLPPSLVDIMDPSAVAPAVAFLVSDDAPSRVILNATAGGFSRTYLHETEGVFLEGAERAAESIAARWDEICDTAGQRALEEGGQQVIKFVTKAAAAAGVDLRPASA
jgi:NAD(P)-dependent dehydrogenase (short-subunit alcohol dehydrogenase family)